MLVESRSRPRQPKDQRYANACLFGAICPARGEGASLVLARADTTEIQLHPAGIATTVSSGSNRSR